MDDLHKIAKAYYTTANEESKSQGKSFFKRMDHDGSGGITIQEYLAYMKRERYTKMANRPFFDYLNKSRTGELDFMEVMTLFYIIKSGRKICDGCGGLLKGTFFSCTDCFANDDESFNLCSKCFTERKYVHPHKHFLDNYIILENMKVKLEEKEKKIKQMKAAKVKMEAALAKHQVPDASNAIVLYNQRRPALLDERCKRE
uniref:EF-hand domain-containing protein n=1 Tax=Populus trichocarpa TaxID=3694 RepID=A0A3N7FBD7_POPTR